MSKNKSWADESEEHDNAAPPKPVTNAWKTNTNNPTSNPTPLSGKLKDQDFPSLQASAKTKDTKRSEIERSDTQSKREGERTFSSERYIPGQSRRESSDRDGSYSRREYSKRENFDEKHRRDSNYERNYRTEGRDGERRESYRDSERRESYRNEGRDGERRDSYSKYENKRDNSFRSDYDNRRERDDRHEQRDSYKNEGRRDSRGGSFRNEGSSYRREGNRFNDPKRGTFSDNKRERTLPVEPPYAAFVGNLPPDSTEEEIRRLFEPELKIKNIQCAQGKNFAHVEFEDLESLKRALSNEKEIGNNKIRIDISDYRFRKSSYESKEKIESDQTETEPPKERKKIQLAPKGSTPKKEEEKNAQSEAYKSSKNPFGEAKPRDENAILNKILKEQEEREKQKDLEKKKELEELESKQKTQENEKEQEKEEEEEKKSEVKSEKVSSHESKSPTKEKYSSSSNRSSSNKSSNYNSRGNFNNRTSTGNNNNRTNERKETKKEELNSRSEKEQKPRKQSDSNKKEESSQTSQKNIYSALEEDDS